MNKKIIIGIVSVILIALVGFLIIKGISGKDESKSNKMVNENTDASQLKEEKNMYKTGKHHAKIEIKNYGTIEVELDADVAPITVANFAKLANEGFYNGLTFHRIIKGFMIQGGDPEGTGMGGSSENIKGEFAVNGVKNNISHIRGTISMARANSYNSASSQFFIVHEDSTFLDRQYAGFGRVTSGIEIVDKICEETKVEDDDGTTLKENQPIIEKIEMID
ncbi:MAG: peptidylprolyl isomerase [Clostridia bacterium]|nr:peptidylprolyl isomerase [Clostridia bacterium]MCI9275716.1 peptidylprolyl isomerase [Clostridia bacterium]